MLFFYFNYIRDSYCNVDTLCQNINRMHNLCKDMSAMIATLPYIVADTRYNKEKQIIFVFKFWNFLCLVIEFSKKHYREKVVKWLQWLIIIYFLGGGGLCTVNMSCENMSGIQLPMFAYTGTYNVLNPCYILIPYYHQLHS